MRNQSIGAPDLFDARALVALAIEWVDEAWREVRADPRFEATMSETEMAGLLFVHLVEAQRRRDGRYGGVLVIEEGYTRSSERLVRADGRIDFKFYASYRQNEHLGVECKRVGENAGLLYRLYVEEGVMRFVSAKYSPGHPWGIMLGFVVDGDMARAATRLEEELAAHMPANVTRPWSSGSTADLYESGHHQDGGPHEIGLYHRLKDCVAA